MEDAKALLDSLMGQTRDVPLKEAKKKKGQNFKEDTACKHYLLGFCPQYEDLFRNTKRHLGECERIHSDMLKAEFEAHPDRLDHEVKYTKDLVRYLEQIIRSADEAVSRQARIIQDANKNLEEKGMNDVAKREIEKIRENCNQLLAEAEELAEAGDIEGSQMKQLIFDQTKQKADEYEEKCKTPIKEEVCQICGLRPEDGDGMRKFSHTEGKIHIGFVKVRNFLKELKERQEKVEAAHKEKREEERNNRRSDGDKDAARSDGDRKDPQGEEREGGERDDRRDRDRRRGGDRERRGAGDREARGGGDREDDNASKATTPEGDNARERRGGGDREARGGDRGPRGGAERGAGGDDREARAGDRGPRGGAERGAGADDAYDRRGGGERERRGGGDRGYEGDHRNDRRSGGDQGDRGRGDRGAQGGRGDRDRGAQGYGYNEGGGRERRQRSRSRDQRRY